MSFAPTQWGRAAHCVILLLQISCESYTCYYEKFGKQFFVYALRGSVADLKIEAMRKVWGDMLTLK